MLAFELNLDAIPEPKKKATKTGAALQPREKTLTEAEIEALSGRIVAAAEKVVGAKLRG